MALPHQVSLSISYDGTVQQAVSQSAAGGGNGGSGSGGDATYTVVSGDCLWNIAKRYYGSGAKYTLIYNANVDIIESTARAHGKKSSSNGHWIWAGEVLTIPGIGGGTSTQSTTKIAKTGSANSALGNEIAAAAESFSYTDVASGESDSVSITMHDINKEWMGSKKPKRGSSLGAAITLTDWDDDGEQKFDCGNFVLDDISFSGRPLCCVLGGVSVPAMDDFKSLPRTKTWEKTTVESIASQIASVAGVSLHYEGPAIQITEIEQSRETDSSFLYSLCEKYGLAMKVYNHKIVIFDFIQYEEKGAVATIKEYDTRETLSWSYNSTIEGTYTGVSLGYTDPDTEKSINVTIGSAGRMYSMNTQASSRYDAELQAAAKVNQANRNIETMEITIRANPKIVASHCVQTEGFGSLDGKYFVDKIRHSVGSGYKMQLSIHKVQSPIKVTAPAPSAGGGGKTYTVVSGDTLWGIAKKFYGTGTKYNLIYDANVDIIESTAKAHGKKSSSGGHWIWAGETFIIPEA